MALFVPFSGPLMPPAGEGWTVERAEELLRSLTGVLSARVVTAASGEVEEIHILTTEQVGAKQTVRNVESALLAHLDLTVDHRRISVAQTKETQKSNGHAPPTGTPAKDGRILFLSHLAEPERAHRVKYQVEVEWQG